MSHDESQLRLLAIFHYVLAGVSALFASLFLMHFFWGIAVLFELPFLGPPGKDDPPRALGIVLMLVGGGAVLVGWSFAAALVVAGRSLSSGKRYLFCLIVAGLMCVLCNPLGTVLGVFTIIVLMRPSVKERFGASGF